MVPESEHGLRREMILPEALRVLDRLDEAGYMAYLCGGGVRDLLLGVEPKDFDVVTDARPEEIKKVFRNCRIIGRRFRLAHIFFREIIIETATFRALLDPTDEEKTAAEAVAVPTRRAMDVPDPTYATRDGVVVRDNVYGSPEEDARRRDFTVNGLFYNIADGSIIDYVGGLKDLEDRVLRVIGDPRARFQEDPVRMVRAIRIASQLSLTVEADAAAAIGEMAGELTLASRERMYEEMLKMRKCGAAQKAFAFAWEKGIFQIIHPGFARWLASDAGAPYMAWVQKALGQFDVWKKAGLAAMPSIQYALLFGPYFEAVAEQGMADGLPPFEAMEQAVPRVLRETGDLTQIPKAVIFEVQRIMCMQVQLAKSTGESRYAEKLRARRGFDLAIIYLKFAAAFHPDRRECLERWLAEPIPVHRYDTTGHRKTPRRRRGGQHHHPRPRNGQPPSSG